MHMCLDMYMYLYIYMYMYLYIYIYMYVCKYIYIYTYMYICMYVRTYVRTYVCMYVCKVLMGYREYRTDHFGPKKHLWESKKTLGRIQAPSGIETRYLKHKLKNL